jgi:hypothetical protein
MLTIVHQIKQATKDLLLLILAVLKSAKVWIVIMASFVLAYGFKNRSKIQRFVRYIKDYKDQDDQ